MKKTILITGSTDGIGLETAKILASKGHNLFIHGRDPMKLERTEKTLLNIQGVGRVQRFCADLSCIRDVESFARAVANNEASVDVLMNNAGVFKTAETRTVDELDIRFAVNTIAPFLLAQMLLPTLSASSRIINLSSAAQSPVDLNALAGRKVLSDDFTAYAQSKLALTMWSRLMGLAKKGNAVIVAVNPGSMLGSKMVKEGFGVAGGDIRIGAEILVRAALSDEFATAHGEYFDNDAGHFSAPHRDALDEKKSEEVLHTIHTVLKTILKNES